MRATFFLPLLAVGTLAAPAPSSSSTVSQPPELDDTTVSMLSKGCEKYTFELKINEQCSFDAKFVTSKSDLHVSATLSHHNGYDYSWKFAKGSPQTLSLDNIGLSVSHDYDVSSTSFEYGDCKWKDGENVDSNCGWCDQGSKWYGPEDANPIDCSARPGSFRYRAITCHLWRKPSSADPLELHPLNGDQKAIAGSTAIVLAPTVNDDVVTLVSNDLAKTILKARGITAEGKFPDNLYRFGVTHSEWCENGALKARGWMHGHELNFHKDFAQKIPINLHPGLNLLFGPYSVSQHAFAIEYDGCVWTSEGGWPCGWCEVKPWTLGPLNCQTLQPGYQRTSYRTCYFIDTHMSFKMLRDDTQLAGRALQPQPSTTLSTPRDNTTFSLFNPPVITAPPQLIDITPLGTGDIFHSTPTQVDAKASTFTLRPAVIETVLPNTPKGHTDLVLPFHIQVWEYCFEGVRLASGVYSNGNIAQSLEFRDDKLNLVGHRVPGYAPSLSIGFEFADSRVRFGFPWREGEREGCEWFDNESWKSCGECREKLWSGGPLDCGDKMGKGMRLKDMDCSLLLVPRQEFELEAGS